MLTFPIKNLFVEGPDCAGKTTLIKRIHNKSKYRWHIFDRSQISRAIFAKLYNRQIENIDLDFHDEISNLNNRFIFLLPEFNVIRDRFYLRGDEIHNDIESIKNVYDAFSGCKERLINFPNIIFSKNDNTNNLASDLYKSLRREESCSIESVSDMVIEFVNNTPDKESYPLSFTLYDDGSFEDIDVSVLEHESEKEYYDMIQTSLIEKIDNELIGENEYGRVEDFSSRRFVFSQSSCISFIQVANRDKVMDFHCVIRSSDVKNIFPYDLKFLTSEDRITQ